jgi:hypothetical protein
MTSEQNDTALTLNDMRQRIKQQIRFGRAKCSVCETKLDDTSAIIKEMDEDGNQTLIPLCGKHARARNYDRGEYSDELKAAIVALRQCTPEEHHWLIQILKKVHKDETRDGICGCNLCERQRGGGDDTLSVNLLDLIPGLDDVHNVLKKLDRVADKLDDTKKEPWVNEKVAIWDNIDKDVSPDPDRTDAPAPSDG